MHIPTHWQYRNPIIDGVEEENPFSFEPYEDSVGCFQNSCYPDGELSNGQRTTWIEKRIDDDEFCMHLYFCMYGDQALIGKFIYDKPLENDPRVVKQLSVVNDILQSIIIVPKEDRTLASSLEKYDRFIGSLGAANDLLYSAINSGSYFEIIAISASIIDAYLRLSLVVKRQIESSTNDIELKYIYQADNEKGLLESHIFQHAINAKIIDQSIHSELKELYQMRNRVIHRYVISNIKTIDLAMISGRYIELTEKVRLILNDLENQQTKEKFGLYGKILGKASVTNKKAVDRLLADVTDKHAMKHLSKINK
jgi:uncharacterized protein YutE (UPF0331/DUF86 family)